MSAEISIKIDESGDITFEVHGVEGPSCEKLTEALVRAAGDEIDKEYTSEFELELPDFIEQFEE